MAEKPPETKKNEDKQSKKGGLVGFAMLAIAAAAGSFGVSYMTTPAPQQNAEACTLEDQAHQAAAPLANLDLVYVPLPDILTTIGSEPATRYLKMNVTIATNKGDASIVDESKLVIIDAFINYLRSIELSDFEDPRFYGHMREQLAHRSEIILGPAASQGVLITEFLIR